MRSAIACGAAAETYWMDDPLVANKRATRVRDGYSAKQGLVCLANYIDGSFLKRHCT
jgi:hypothetical protein